VGACGENIADDGLGLLLHAEGVATDFALVGGDIANEQVRVHVLQQQVGRSAIVPMQTFAPQCTLFVEQRAQVLCPEMTQV